jgi:mono/diheme cytochrome c family protein
MSWMPKPARLAALALAAPLVAFATQATRSRAPLETEGDEAALRRRGAYLVHQVAMCVQCHSPRDEAGRLVRQRLLHGGAVPVENPFRDSDWAFRAPHIAGLPGYTDDQAVRLLTEGITSAGTPPRDPMPPYRLERDDALAVVAYLRSLR